MAKHINPERMKVTLPAGYRPSYWGQVTGVRASITAAGGHPNEWVLIGRRAELVALADKVAAFHASVGGAR